MTLRNAFENLSTKAKQNVANVLLTAIRDQVKDGSTDTVLSLLRDIATNDPITGTVALDTPTLMALEQTTVTVSNPTANPEIGLAKEATLGALLTELGQKLEPADLAALSTAAKQDAAKTVLDSILTKLNATLSADINDRAARVLGHVTIDNFPTTQPVSGTVAISNPTANPETGLAKEVTVGQRYAGGKLAATAQVTMAGNNTIITPSEGKSIRVFWVSAINNPDQASTPRMIFKFGTTEIYRAYALAHWEIFTGATNQPLVLELNSGGDVAVTVHYQEI